MTDRQTETRPFDTDVARLLEIVAGALYTNKDIFLRELISNAADACDRLRYEAVANTGLKTPDAYEIRIFRDAENQRLTVRDNGIGMDEADLAQNLGTIAHSGTAKIMEAAAAKGDTAGLIGQFGVGFYASFMVADQVEVVSRKAGATQIWHWSSDGKSGYALREASAEEAALLDGQESGTAVRLHLKGEAFDYVLEDKIRMIVRDWSDHINVPVYIGEKAEDEAPINAAAALWTRPKGEISEEEYKAFYASIGHGFDEPLLTAHWKAEGVIEYTGLLFVPTLRPWDLYDPGRKPAVRLYVRRVFIAEASENLIYPWLRFVRGVIDSQDLPLNISREMLQASPVLTKIRSGVTRKILSELRKLSESDETAYGTFWHQFGAVLKEGLYDAVEHRPDIFKLCRFFSSEQGEQLTSLDSYVERMKDGQDEIYYISGEKLEALQNSPQLEGFRARGLEVLLLTDTIDSFWLQMAPDYRDKKFVSITKGTVDLNKFPATDKDADDKPEEAAGEENSDTAQIESLRGHLETLLKDKVAAVRLSSRLTSSPVCLVAADTGVDMQMERVLKMQQHYEPQTKRILEINAGHPLLRALAGRHAASESDPDIENAALLLYDQATVIQGEPVDDPAGFAARLSRFMQSGLAA